MMEDAQPPLFISVCQCREHTDAACVSSLPVPIPPPPRTPNPPPAAPCPPD